jgi:hypothetical protein
MVAPHISARIGALLAEAHRAGLRANARIEAGYLLVEFAAADGSGVLLEGFGEAPTCGEYYTLLPLAVRSPSARRPLAVRSPLLLRHQGCGLPPAWESPQDPPLRAWAARLLPFPAATCFEADVRSPHMALPWIAQLRPAGDHTLLVARAANRSHTGTTLPPTGPLGGLAWFADLARALGSTFPPGGSFPEGKFLQEPNFHGIAVGSLRRPSLPPPPPPNGPNAPTPATLPLIGRPPAVQNAPPLAATVVSQERPKKS